MSEAMICPACGAEMNLHAEKLVYAQTDLGTHTAMGEGIAEVHSCPGCGRTEWRASGTS